MGVWDCPLPLRTVLLPPLVAAVNFAGSMILFYYTPLFELAITTHLGHILMVVHFTLVGYFFVNALVGIDPGPNRPGYPQRFLLLLATMAFHAFFGVSLMASDRLLVPDWFGNMGRAWGTPPSSTNKPGRVSPGESEKSPPSHSP